MDLMSGGTSTGVGAAAGSFLGPLGAAGGAIVGGLVDAGMSFFNQSANNRTQKYLARLAYDKQLEQWNRANAYNSPASQMMRLKEAGLNPNLVYGNGTVTGNTTPTGNPMYRPPDIRYDAKLNALNTISAYQDYTLKQKQIDAVQKENEGRDLANILAAKTLQDNITLAANRQWESYWRRMHGGLGYNSDLIDYNVKEGQYESGNLTKYAQARLDQLLGNIGLISSEQKERAERLKVTQEDAKMQAIRAQMLGMDKEFYYKTLQLRQEALQEENKWNKSSNRWIRESIGTIGGLAAPFTGLYGRLATFEPRSEQMGVNPYRSWSSYNPMTSGYNPQMQGNAFYNKQGIYGY